MKSTKSSVLSLNNRILLGAFEVHIWQPRQSRLRVRATRTQKKSSNSKIGFRTQRPISAEHVSLVGPALVSLKITDFGRKFAVDRFPGLRICFGRPRLCLRQTDFFRLQRSHHQSVRDGSGQRKVSGTDVVGVDDDDGLQQRPHLHSGRVWPKPAEIHVPGDPRC